MTMPRRLGLFLLAATCVLVAPLHADPVSDFTRPDAAAKLKRQGVKLGLLQQAADGVVQRPAIFQPGARPTLTLTPDAAGWSALAQGELHLRVQNGMPWAVTLEVDIEDAVGGHLHSTVGLPPGPPQTLVLPLRAISSRAFGMQVGPPMPWNKNGHQLFLAGKVEGTLDATQITAVHLSVPNPSAPQTLLFGVLYFAADDADLHAAYAGIVDRYGQAVRGRWPEKIDDDAALLAARKREDAALQSRPGSDRLDTYGGRLDVHSFKPSGWFRTERRDGRWWLVTPAGHAFFSLGVNVVAADNGPTFVEGREFMFVDLPSQQGNLAAFYGSADERRGDFGAGQGMGFNHGRWFDFYLANLYRVDGAGWLPAWRQRALQRLPAWGFNTIGNWSDPTLAQAHRIAYTRLLNIAGSFGTVSAGDDYWGPMPDPFDPRFAQAAERAAAKIDADTRDDPWMLGYFADNELAWANWGPQGRWGLARGTLRGEVHSAAKQAFIAVLREKYGEPAKLAAAWGIALPSWQALEAAGFAAPLPNEAHPAITDDYHAWLSQYAEQYFRLVAAAIHRHDPHHLYLGTRFAAHTPEAVAACARYCDVISFNVYADLPQHGFDDAALHALDKPALISEFHFGSGDRGPFGKGVASVDTEQQRGEAYAKFVTAAASDTHIVGTHWFEYVDQPVTGRTLDGENSHIGLVGITDIPFGGFVDAVHAANRRVLGQGD